jgi:hypothetical protein
MNKIIVVLSTVLMAAMTGCASYPNHVSLTDGQKKAMKDSKARGAILVDSYGQVVVVGENGERVKRCTAEPGGKGDLKQCRGLQKGNEVQNIRSLTLIRSKINPECWTFVDAVLGFAEEVCW